MQETKTQRKTKKKPQKEEEKNYKIGANLIDSYSVKIENVVAILH